MPGSIDREEGRWLFGADPQTCHEIRPPYPAPLYELLVATGALHQHTVTLEIGAGSGLATRRLLGFGADPIYIARRRAQPA